MSRSAPATSSSALSNALATIARSPLFWIATVVMIGGATALLVMAESRADKRDPSQLPLYGQMPAFELTDHRGAPATAQAFAGKIVIANFIFTRCPTVCPVFTMKMKRVQERTSELGDHIALISFSVDPEHDTPQVLTAYAEKFSVDTTRWSFLTGPLDAVKKTVEGSLKIAMVREGSLENGVPDIVHGTHFVLLDATGRIRGYYDSDVIERIDDLVADALALADSIR